MSNESGEAAYYPDHALAALQSMANQGVGLNVTLLVHGAVIKGRLISGRAYFDGLADGLMNAGVLDDSGVELGGDWGETRAYIAGMVGRFASEYPDTAIGDNDNDNDNDNDDDVQTVFIHLAEVRIHAVQPSEPRQLSLWRGRLAAVDGWSLGT